ncbi:MAG: hypothetical protein ACYTG7_00735 [Planctomycetota bacterium]|jgi:hypothetical protein
MDSRIAADRYPKGLVVAIGLFLLCMFAGLVILMFRDVPHHARPEIIEKHFAEQIAFLKEIAFACPDPSRPSLTDSEGKVDESALQEYDQIWKAWSKKAESRPDLLSHPAILGVSIFVFDGMGGKRAQMTLKEYRNFEPSLMDSIVGFLGPNSGTPDVDRPVIRHWYEGKRHLARYENLFLNPEGVEMGSHLILDLDHIEKNMPAPCE